MELSRKCLECLEVFRKRVFEDDEHVKSVVQTVIDHLLERSTECVALLGFLPADVLEHVTSEDTSCQYGLSVLLLQSARRGLASAELE